MATRNKIEIVLSAITQGFENRLRAASSAVKSMGREAGQAGTGLSAARRGIESISTALDRMQSLAVGAFAFDRLKWYTTSFARTADTMRDLDQRLLTTSRNTADYAAAQQTVVDVARASHQGLADVGALYSRMALATANLNVSQQELADVTRTVALATAMSGTSAGEASAGLQQLAQAMGANRLQGDELRSVLENMPLLTQVFVNAAGGSIATLREMATNGELTTQWMIDAIKGARDTIEAQAAAMPKTVGRAMTDLKNEFSIYVDQVNKATGGTDIMSASIQWLGRNLDLAAKGGALALATALSVLVGRGITATVAASALFVARLGAMTTAATTAGAAVSSAAAYMSGSYARAASTAAATTATRLIPALTSLVNPITAITTVLGIGATAWAIWGRSADDELSKAKQRLAQLQQTNQMLKEVSDPSLRLRAISGKIAAARDEVSKLEKELAETAASPTSDVFLGGDDGVLRHLGGKLDEAREKLKVFEREQAAIQENIKLSAEQRGAKEIATEMSVTEAIGKQDEERRKITASRLENELAAIEKKREAELKSVGSQYSANDQARIKAAINARFDAEATKAREEDAERVAKASAKAAKAAERAAAKEQRAAEKRLRAQRELAAEKARAASQERILALELEKLDADTLPTELARAEARMDINKRIAAENIRLKQQELAAMKEDAARPKSNTSQADVIRAQAELAAMKVDAVKQEHTDLAQVVSDRMDEVEQAWRSGRASVEEYRAAVQAAGDAGVVTADEVREKLVASGDDLGEALALGFEKAKTNMQTDAEVMIFIGENIGDQIAGNMTSAWTDFVNGSKSAKEAMVGFASSTLSWLEQIILKQMLLNALESVGLGFSGGGQAIQTFAGGGWAQPLADGGAVQGWSPSKTADNIPAWLTAREFVHPVDAVDYYGLPFMEAVRRRLFPRSLARALAGATLPSVPSGYRLAQGGQAAAPSAATTVKAGDVKLAVVNVRDESQIKGFLNTSEFDDILVNRIRRNGSTIRTLIGG